MPQLRDMKMSAEIDIMDDAISRHTRECAGWARAHARPGDAAMIAGYMGSGRTFDEAICDFAGDHSDQAEPDHQAFVKAAREGRVNAVYLPVDGGGVPA